MPFYGQTLQSILIDSITELANNTNITKLSPGSKARAILDTMGKRLEKAYDTFDLNLARAFLSSAPGQYLDLFGDLLALPRLQAETSTVDDTVQCLKFYVKSGTFGDINGGQSFVIPRNQIISSQINNTGVQYRLLSDVTCSSSASLVYFSGEAISPGEQYNIGSNILTYHDFIGYSDFLNKTLLVNNIHPIGNGKDWESDTNYRYRLSKRVLEAEAANETAIRLAALSTPGVADVILTKFYKGIGTFGVIIKATVPTVSDSLISDVSSRIRNVEGYGSKSFVIGPKETGFSIILNIYYRSALTEDDYATIESEIQNTIIEYINNTDIGETIYIDRMISSLYSISTEILNIGEYATPYTAYVYTNSRLQDNKIRQKLLTNYVPATDERVIIEPSISNPIVLNRIVNKGII